MELSQEQLRRINNIRVLMNLSPADNIQAVEFGIIGELLGVIDTLLATPPDAAPVAAVEAQRTEVDGFKLGETVFHTAAHITGVIVQFDDVRNWALIDEGSDIRRPEWWSLANLVHSDATSAGSE